MKTFFELVVLISTVAMLAACGKAKPPSSAPAPVSQPREVPGAAESLSYLSKDAVPIASAIPAPYPTGSAATRAELDQILQLQASRTAEDCARIGVEAQVSLEDFFGPAYGPLTKAEVQSWTPFFEESL